MPGSGGRRTTDAGVPLRRVQGALRRRARGAPAAPRRGHRSRGELPEGESRKSAEARRRARSPVCSGARRCRVEGGPGKVERNEDRRPARGVALRARGRGEEAGGRVSMTAAPAILLRAPVENVPRQVTSCWSRAAYG